ncbi:SAM-dependent methyltransferase [Streptomyces decoyicus]
MARVYDRLLGGKNNYAADCELADMLSFRADWILRAAEINRAHTARTTAHLVRQGIRQIVDLGCGYPSPPQRALPNTFQAATRVVPEATVVHVDHDRVVAAHARAHLSGPPGQHSVVCADIRKMTDLLDAPAMTALDHGRPIGVLLHDVLPWITSDLEVHTLLTDLRAWLPPGSVISTTHLSADMRPDDVENLVDLYEGDGIPVRPRTADQIQALHAPWPLLGPGLVPTGQWHADQLHALLPDHESGAFAAVSAHPEPAS